MGEFSKNLSKIVENFKKGYNKEKEIRANIIEGEGIFLHQNTHKIYEFIKSFESSSAMRFGRTLYNGIHFLKCVESQEIVLDYLLSHPGLFVKFSK